MSFCFLHTSDLHLGKPFGGYPEGIRNRLREARHGAIATLAQVARRSGAGTILLAGDTFDAETPAPDTRRQALRAMAAASDLTWLLLPGNHDSLAATELWRQVRAEAAPNLRLLDSAAPVPLAPDAVLLPAPCTQRRPGRDLTDGMAATATPEGQHRIGLAHGAIVDFSGDEGARGIIPPDRAQRSGLGYLALGDWHGMRAVGDRTCYSGTPEPDAFGQPDAAVALVVTVTAPGGVPQIVPVETGMLRWPTLTVDLLAGDDLSPDRLLPPVTARRDMVLRLILRGRLRLPDRTALIAALASAAPDFGWFDCNSDALAVEAMPDDLDQIARSGALRLAAETLLAEACDPALSAGDRTASEQALARLFALSQEVGA